VNVPVPASRGPNGKAERFIRTMLGGWAYGAIYANSAERIRALPGWLDFYNHHKPHGSLGGEYFDGVASELAQAGGNAAQAFSSAFRDLGNTLVDEIASEIAGGRDVNPGLVHLKDASTFAPGDSPPSGFGFWWRGRLAAVDGWRFGT
jgi:Integrase core domain